jgi:sortase B
MENDTQDPKLENESQALPEAKPKAKRNHLLTIIAFALLASFIVFGSLFFKETIPYWKGNKAYADMNKMAVVVKEVEPVSITAIAENYMQTQVSIPVQTNAPGMPNMTQTPVPTLTAYQLDLLRIQQLIEIDFDYLKGVNPDIVGWIFMERENINYPIVLGPDNYFYLTRLPDKTPNRLGSIFMEYKNKPDFSDDTTVLFGHNMLDDSMFAPLEYYREQWYYDEHPSLYIFTPEDTYRLDVFAGYVVEAHDIDSLHQTINSIEEKREFVANSIMRSTFESNVQINDDDRFVSLFTCAYDYSDARYVVQTKLVKLTP